MIKIIHPWKCWLSLNSWYEIPMHLLQFKHIWQVKDSVHRCLSAGILPFICFELWAPIPLVSGELTSAMKSTPPKSQTLLRCWCFTHWGSCQCHLLTILVPAPFLDRDVSLLPEPLVGGWGLMTNSDQWATSASDKSHPWPHEAEQAACLYLTLLRQSRKACCCGKPLGLNENPGSVTVEPWADNFICLSHPFLTCVMVPRMLIHACVSMKWNHLCQPPSRVPGTWDRLNKYELPSGSQWRLSPLLRCLGRGVGGTGP